MRVPLAGFSVLEKYGPRWSGFDTPRHRYLLAVFLLYHQAPRAGLETINVSYDSSAKRFHSEIAVNGIPIKRVDDHHVGGPKAFFIIRLAIIRRRAGISEPEAGCCFCSFSAA